MSAALETMSPELRRGAFASFALHVLLLCAVLIGLPLARPPEPPPETAVDMVFQTESGPPAKAATPAPGSAPARAATPTPARPAAAPPKPQPLEDTTPPPPPPPPPPVPSAVRPPPAPPLPPRPAPTPAPTEALPLPPPPVPPPPAPASPVRAQPTPAPARKLPLPPPVPPSPTAQPNPTANPAPSSAALENTLERLRALARAQQHAPQARANPRPGGVPDAGGSPAADATGALSGAERGAIGEHVRPCWTSDPGAPDLDRMSVLLTVTTDADGVVRRASVATADESRLSNPSLRAFAERAVRAVMSPACANLPLPPRLLGKVNVLTFRFRP